MDSPKVPEKPWPWPTHTIARVLVKLARGPVVPGNYFYAIRHGDKPADDEETYIPVSPLLSDEVVREAARKICFSDALWEEHRESYESTARIAIQAAMRQVQA